MSLCRGESHDVVWTAARAALVTLAAGGMVFLVHKTLMVFVFSWLGAAAHVATDKPLLESRESMHVHMYVCTHAGL